MVLTLVFPTLIMSKTGLVQSTNFFVLAWCPEQYKTYALLYSQIGGLVPDLLILTVFLQNSRCSPFIVYHCYNDSLEFNWKTKKKEMIPQCLTRLFFQTFAIAGPIVGTTIAGAVADSSGN